MANPKIQVDITADAKGLKKGAKEAGEAVDDLGEKAEKAEKKVRQAGEGVDKSGEKLAGFGSKAGEVAKNRLGPLGDIADEIGIDIENMDNKVLAAGAGIVAIGGFAAQGVQKFSALADEVRKVHDASGLTFEDSSRLVAVSDDLGISADTAAASMGRLAKNIDAGKLEEFGIQVVRAKDGSVDMAATLGNVADAMNRTTDPAKRAAMGTALFGKSWADLAPVLQLGRKGIEDAFGAVSDGQIVTEENAQSVRDWQMALDDAQDAVTEIQMAIGKQLLPTLSLMAKDFAAATNAVGKLTGESIGLGDIQSLTSATFGLYNFRAREQAEANEKAAKSMVGLSDKMADAAVRAAETGRANQDLAQSEEQAAIKADILRARHEDVARAAEDAARATEEQRKQLDLLNGAVTTIVGSQLAYDRSVTALNESTDQLTWKHAEMTEAIATYGEGSKEAWQTTRDYQMALQDAKGSADAQAKASADLAQKQAEANGVTFTAEQYQIVYRDSLNKVRDAANDPNLKSGLDGLIGQVDGTAAAAGRARQELDAAEAAARRLAAVAAGVGTTSSGQIVGSADRLESTIATQSIGRQSAGGAQDRRQVVNINVNTPIGNPRDVVTWMREELRKAERAQR